MPESGDFYWYDEYISSEVIFPRMVNIWTQISLSAAQMMIWVTWPVSIILTQYLIRLFTTLCFQMYPCSIIQNILILRTFACRLMLKDIIIRSWMRFLVTETIFMLSLVVFLLLPLGQDAILGTALPRVGFSVWGGNMVENLGYIFSI